MKQNRLGGGLLVVGRVRAKVVFLPVRVSRESWGVCCKCRKAAVLGDGFCVKCWDKYET